MASENMPGIGVVEREVIKDDNLPGVEVEVVKREVTKEEIMETEEPNIESATQQSTADASSNSNQQLETRSKRYALPDPMHETMIEPVDFHESVSLTSLNKINKAVEIKNVKGETLLHESCRLGKKDAISKMLDEGSNPNTKNKAGWTPLHVVVQNGRLDLVHLLLKYYTLINVPGQANQTPLHEAIRCKHYDIAEFLVKNGADLNARNRTGVTPLQLASNGVKKMLLAATTNTIQTSSAYAIHMSTLFSKLNSVPIRVYCASGSVSSRLASLAESHKNLHIVTHFNKRVTHMVVDTDENGVCRSNLTVLHGIINSIWILSSRWVTNSNEDKLEPFEEYEVTGVGTIENQGPKKSRINKYMLLPGIFNGCRFYFHNLNRKLERNLSMLITKGGGVHIKTVLYAKSTRKYDQYVPYHAKSYSVLRNRSHYIIYKQNYDFLFSLMYMAARPVSWLCRCIVKYELYDTRDQGL